MDDSPLHIFENDDGSPAAQLQSIKDRIGKKYAPRIAAAGRLRRAFLIWKMQHEIEAEIAKAARSIAARL